MSSVSRSLQGCRVVSLESRRSGELATLVRKRGGVAIEAPSLRELPIGSEENPEALRFARALVDGKYDAVLFLTGVGTQYLTSVVEREIPRQTWIEALNRITVVARGPKPVAALKELGVRIDHRVPEPNTWREILKVVQDHLPAQGLRMAVQEYGQPNPELVEGLEKLGVQVDRVPVYRWGLPEDCGPLKQAIGELVGGRVNAAMFTSAQQVVHLMQVAEREGKAAAVKEALHGDVIVASIGPITSQSLKEQGIEPDFEPEHPKMGYLVGALAQRWTDRQPEQASTERSSLRPITDRAQADRPAWEDGPFWKACHRQPTDVTPVWLMRQAGRYMPEYRAVRDKVSFLELCHTPELACQVTVEAAEILGVDAAILFADILLILQPMGLDLDFARGEGPQIHNPIREAKDLDRLIPADQAEPLETVFEAVRLIRQGLPSHIPLIGFAGAPFTLACYATEGRGSKTFAQTKQFLYRDRGAWQALMNRLADATAAYLLAQVEAGAQVLQLFDSWVGLLSPSDYRDYVLPAMRRLFAQLPSDVPTIHFGTGTATLLDLQAEAGGSIIGLDWRVELDTTWQRLGTDRVGVQGNLDPTVLLGPREIWEPMARRILHQAGGRPGHIFNLGHGILPQTPVDHAKGLIDLVHETRI